MEETKKFTMKTLLDAAPALRKITSQELPVKVLYPVSKQMKKLEGILDFYEEERGRICNKYREEKDGKSILKPGCSEAFEHEFSELLDLDLTSENIEPVEIPADENLRLSYVELCSLEGIVTIKFEEETKEGETA